jgi:hypothetical protein
LGTEPERIDRRRAADGSKCDYVFPSFVRDERALHRSKIRAGRAGVFCIWAASFISFCYGLEQATYFFRQTLPMKASWSFPIAAWVAHSPEQLAIILFLNTGQQSVKP